MPQLIEKPTRIAAAGNKPKIIEEFSGTGDLARRYCHSERSEESRSSPSVTERQRPFDKLRVTTRVKEVMPTFIERPSPIAGFAEVVCVDGEGAVVAAQPL